MIRSFDYIPQKTRNNLKSEQDQIYKASFKPKHFRSKSKTRKTRKISETQNEIKNFIGNLKKCHSTAK